MSNGTKGKNIMKKITSMEELTEKAILITKDTVFHDPYDNKVFTYNPTLIFSNAFKKHYDIENGVVSFFDNLNNWYVIPAVKGVVEILKRERFIKGGFAVPCSEDCCLAHRTYPIDKKEDWLEMMRESLATR